jgi:hypothetical protein
MLPEIPAPDAAPWAPPGVDAVFPELDAEPEFVFPGAPVPTLSGGRG